MQNKGTLPSPLDTEEEKTNNTNVAHLATHLEHFEMIFLRLLHLLAHHPDFQLTEEAIPDIAK